MGHARYESLTSHRNPKIKFALGLRDRDERETSGCFAVEGSTELARALDAGYEPRDIYVRAGARHPDTERWIERAIAATDNQLGVYDVSDSLFERLVVRAQGDILAVFPLPAPRALGALPEIQKALFLVVDGVEKPGNIGALMRTADCVACDAVIGIGEHVDFYNPNLLRASLGTALCLPSLSADLGDFITHCRTTGICIVAATPGNGVLYTDADLSGSVAIVVGSEALGIQPALQRAADLCVQIPMYGKANSLNASVSGALLLYEAARQRRFPSP